MKQTLNELDFKYIPQKGVECWSKMYKGFILFIAKSPKDDTYLASITIGKIEISIPNTIDDVWCCEFDSQNSLAYDGVS
jgi:hypothetical protein